MSPFFFNSFFILVQYIILKLNVSSHPPVYEKDTIFWSSTPTNFSYEPPLYRNYYNITAQGVYFAPVRYNFGVLLQNNFLEV
jgi:hypothetical protein